MPSNPPDVPFGDLASLKKWLTAADANAPITLAPAFFIVNEEPCSSVIERLFERIGSPKEITLCNWSWAETSTESTLDGPGVAAAITLAGHVDVMSVNAACTTLSLRASTSGKALIAHMAISLGEEAEWGIHSLIQAHLKNIELTFEPEQEWGIYRTSVVAELVCGQVSVQVGVNVPPYPADWIVHGTFYVEGKQHPITIDDLIKLIAGHDVLRDLQKEELKKLLNAAGLRDVRIAFDPDAGSLSQISTTLEVAPWEFSDHLTVRDLQLEVTVPFVDNAPSEPFSEVHGYMDIGEPKIPVLVEARFPDLDLTVSLAPGHPLQLAPLLGHWGVHLPACLGSPEIDVLTIHVNLDDKSMQLEVVVAAKVEVIPRLALRSLTFQLGKDSAAGWNGRLSAFSELGGQSPLVISADYGTSDGLTFTGRYERSPNATSGLTIGGWITRLRPTTGIQEDNPLLRSIAHMEIVRFGVEFSTSNKDLKFDMELKVPVGNIELDATLHFEFKAGECYDIDFEGAVHLGKYEFKFDAKKRSAGSYLVGSCENMAPDGLDLAELFEKIPSIGQLLPQGLTISVKDMFVAYSKPATSPGKTLFGIDLGAGIDLSALPLVGGAFSGDTLKVDQLKFLLASDTFAAEELKTINSFLAKGEQIPVPVKEDNNGPEPSLRSGASVSAQVTWIGERRPVLMGANTNSSNAGGTTSGTTTTTAAPASSNVKWFQLDRSFGPVHLGRVGVQYEKQVLSFLLDGSLGAGGITLSLIGLSVGSEIKAFVPHFDLQGLGLDIETAAVGISGAFKRQHVEGAPPAEAYDQYIGAAMIRTRAFTLGALGAYANYQGHPSLFIYAVLDMPLGGPAFFFVTGLAAGFGYNRGLILPGIDQVKDFPLVAEVTSPTTKTLDQRLQSLQSYIPPSPGDQFFAIGIKFTSFKMIESFALLAVKFGHEVEVDVLGLSTLVVPTAEADAAMKAPLARVQLALKATYQPAQGFLGVSALLTSSSFILSQKCHLTGGFAFYSWFGVEHNGDFALTLGGYHPHYKVPSHYPQVPRVGFNWQVSDELSVSGDAYFALVPSAVMAGGHLNAVWQSGQLKAWFKAGADFLIAWKPYCYEAEVYVDIGVSYTFKLFGWHTISVDVGADLRIWGPEFSGIATVHLWIVDFDVSFGSSSRMGRTPIEWDQFITLLPDQKISVTVRNGLVVKGTGTDLGVVNPKELSIAIECVMPIAHVSGVTLGSATVPGFGITPMDRKNVGSILTITGADASLKGTALLKPQPSALWGNHGIAGGGGELTEDLLYGVLLNAPPSTMAPAGGIRPDLGDFDTARVTRAFALRPGMGWQRYDQKNVLPGTTAASTASLFSDWAPEATPSYGEQLYH